MLISDDCEIIAGHGRAEAAKLLGRKTVPTLAFSHLSATERRAYVLADNKLTLNSGWDKEMLSIELQALVDFEFDAELTGFTLAEVDLMLDEANESDPGIGRSRRRGQQRLEGPCRFEGTSCCLGVTASCAAMLEALRISPR